MNNGFFIMPRFDQYHPFAFHKEAEIVYYYLLKKARFNDENRGEITTTLSIISEDTTFSVSRVRRALKTIFANKLISTIKTGKGGGTPTILRIENYSAIQDFKSYKTQIIETKKTNKNATPKLNGLTALTELTEELKTHTEKCDFPVGDGAIAPKKAKKEDKGKSEGSEVFDAYAEGYVKRYGTMPIRNAKVNAQCKNLVKTVGKDRAKELVTYYAQEYESWRADKSAHDLGTLLFEIQAVNNEAVILTPYETRLRTIEHLKEIGEFDRDMYNLMVAEAKKEFGVP